MKIDTLSDNIRLGLIPALKGWKLIDNKHYKRNLHFGNKINHFVNKKYFAVEVMVCVYENK